MKTLLAKLLLKILTELIKQQAKAYHKLEKTVETKPKEIKPKTPKRVITEKGSIITLAMTLIASGSTQMALKNYEAGLALLAVGVILIFIREYFKFHRWHHHSYWHNKEIG